MQFHYDAEMVKQCVYLEKCIANGYNDGYFGPQIPDYHYVFFMDETAGYMLDCYIPGFDPSKLIKFGSKL